MERFYFLFFFSVFISFPVFAVSQLHFREKPSLKQITESIQKQTEVTELMKKTQNYLDSDSPFPEKKVQQIYQAHLKKMTQLKNYFTSSESFVRGEIEDEKVLNNIIQYLQISLLQVRGHFVKNQDLQAKEELHAWLMFAADFPYEEASLISLRFANLIRSLVFDEIETIQKKWPDRWAKDELWFHWSQKIRASWPIDRVVITESKKVLADRLLRSAQEVAMSLQKNPYQSIEVVLNSVRGGKAKELQFLKNLWRDTDILAMKTEVTRISAFHLRLARAIYEHRSSQKLTQLDELVTAKLIERVPINYLTGKPFELAATAL